MESGLTKKYGLVTAIAMVVGIVIGSGVFFKAEVVLTATGGNLPIGILAWTMGGLVMVICAYMFSILAVRYENVGGLLGYVEAVTGPRYGYYVGGFIRPSHLFWRGFPHGTPLYCWAGRSPAANA